MNPLGPLDISLKSGAEPFHCDGNALPRTLLNFWQWTSSDLVNNALRGVLAEYLIATALECDQHPRREWDAYDLVTAEGITVEVKSAAYLQSWSQQDYSTIQFSIKPSLGWNATDNTYSPQSKRQADIYVFCVLKHKDKASVDPLNVSQWDFYILQTSTLNDRLGQQSTLGLSSLLNLNPIQASYESIYSEILELMSDQKES